MHLAVQQYVAFQVADVAGTFVLRFLAVIASGHRAAVDGLKYGHHVAHGHGIGHQQRLFADELQFRLVGILRVAFPVVLLQPFHHGCAVGVGACQDADVFLAVAAFQRIENLSQGLIFGIHSAAQKTDLDISRSFLLWNLADIAVQILKLAGHCRAAFRVVGRDNLAEMADDETEQRIVPFHYPRVGAPVGVFRRFVAGRLHGAGAELAVQLPLHTGVDQFRFGVAETVYALFGIADYQVVVASRQAFHHKGAQVDPLHFGCVLELVDEQMVQQRAETLVHERRVIVLDEIVQDHRGLAQFHGTVLAQVFQTPFRHGLKKSQEGEADAQGFPQGAERSLPQLVSVLHLQVMLFSYSPSALFGDLVLYRLLAPELVRVEKCHAFEREGLELEHLPGCAEWLAGVGARCSELSRIGGSVYDSLRLGGHGAVMPSFLLIMFVLQLIVEVQDVGVVVQVFLQLAAYLAELLVVYALEIGE